MRSRSPVAAAATKLAGLTAAAALAATGFAATANAGVVSGALDCAPTGMFSVDGGYAAPDGKYVKDRPQDIPTALDMAVMEADLAERLAALEFDPATVDIKDPIDINVYFHVIREDRSNEGGNVPRTMIREQMKVLNHAYRGKGAADPGARTPFKFTLGGHDGIEDGVERITNDDWFNHSEQEDVELEMKSATRVGTAADLNIWTTGVIGVGLLGYATFPSDYEANPMRDGVVMDPQSMPGGLTVPYDKGDTAVHEVGHWFGLYHTFENGCTPPGDYVEDTPYEAEPYFGECMPDVDTCEADPGNDPIENFMDYSDDICMDRFTKGQRERALDQWYAYRDSM